MNHLSPETLLDLAEGTRADESEAHLAHCERCRQELNDLRAILPVATGADVPEPSPLFWDHLSARISAAVEQEQRVPPRGWTLLTSPWRLAALAAAGVAVFAVLVTFRTVPDGVETTTDTVRDTAQTIVTDPPLSFADDPSLNLIVDLAGGIEWDDATEAGLAVGGDDVEQAVRDLTNEQRVELSRVLREAIDDARASGRGV